ncbi:MAG: non-hydrolyzing UDP-N-acetylglucosamine 2-epimerase [Planctomycetaceae bacterium]
MKLLTVVGARPQFIKAAVVSRAFLERDDVDECLLHTGQHYDEKMSQVFFDELRIPRPQYNLAVGSGSHGKQTGRMLEGIENAIVAEQPDAVLVYGDTNSTLAGALAAAKLHVKVAHVEAGLRSFNRRMPEEVNRVLTDHVSDRLFCPTDEAVRNLAAEGITRNVHQVGDVMFDCTRQFGAIAESAVDPLAEHGLSRKEYVLMTCHRAENTDEEQRLQQILAAAADVSQTLPVLFPVHPRTRNKLAGLRSELPADLRLVEPASYLEMLVLERNAALVLTDSGGVQKEAFFCGVPCVTLRDETEWSETVECGANILAGADRGRILAAVERQRKRTDPLPDPGALYGEGRASQRIAESLFR